MKTPISYYGGKQMLSSLILGLIPEHRIYCEPFFGGGALYFHLEPQDAIINDINAKLIGFYDGVKNDYPHLHAELSEVEKIYEENRRDFDELKKQHPTERVEDKNEVAA